MIKKIMIVILLLPTSVLADSINISCSKKQASDNLSCLVKADSNKEVSALHFKYKYDNLKFLSYETDFEGIIDESEANLYTDSNKKDNFEVGVINFKTLSDLYEVKLEEVIFYDKDFNEVEVKNIKNANNISEKKDYDMTNIIKYVIILLIGLLIIIVGLGVMRKCKK